MEFYLFFVVIAAAFIGGYWLRSHIQTVVTTAQRDVSAELARLTGTVAKLATPATPPPPTQTVAPK